MSIYSDLSKRFDTEFDSHNVPMGEDFHAFNSDIVRRIIAAADEHKYRKPKDASGSRARMFYEYANRGRHD